MKYKLINEDLIDKQIIYLKGKLSRWENVELFKDIDERIEFIKLQRHLHVLEVIKKELISPKEEISKAIEYGLWSFEDFDRTSNYDKESREEGLKEIINTYLKQNNYD